MENKMRQWMFMALMVLSIGGLLTACSGDDENAIDPDKTIVSKDYKDYVASNEMKSDVQTIVEGAMKLQALKWEMYKNFTNNFKLKGIKEYDPWNGANWDRFYELATEIGQNADRYTQATQNLYDKGVLTTKTPQTRVFTAIVGGYMKMKDKLYEGHEKILNTMKQPGMATPQKWEEMFNSLQYSRDRLGCYNWQDWRNKIANRDAGIIESTEIFEQLCQNNEDFHLAATNAGYGNNPVAETTREVGGTALEVAVDVYANAAATGSGAIGLGKEAFDVVNASGNFVKAVKDGENISQAGRDVISTISCVVASHVGGEANNYLYTETFNAVQKTYKETVEKNLNEAEAAENGANEGTGTGVIEVEDKDTKSPGNIVIAEKPDGKTTIAVGKDGKTVVPVSGDGKYTLTTIDDTGDKNTTDVNVDKKGTKTTVEVKTNESELIDAQEQDKYDWDIETDPEELVFGAGGDLQVVTVITEYKVLNASSKDKWIDVEVSGRNLFVEVTENETGNVRKGQVTIYASNDGKNVLKTATLNVTQMTEEANDLSFINFKNLTVEIGKNNIGFVMPDISYVNSRFNTSDLTITRISNDKYTVKGKRAVGNYYGPDGLSQSDKNYYVKPGTSYGVYYDFSFNIEAVAPWLMVEKNNIRITDLRIKGYRKFIEKNIYLDDDNAGMDRWGEFDTYCSGMGIFNIDEYDGGSNKIAVLSSYNQERGELDDEYNYQESSYPFTMEYSYTDISMHPKYEEREYVDEDGKTKKRIELVGYEESVWADTKVLKEISHVNIAITLRW